MLSARVLTFVGIHPWSKWVIVHSERTLTFTIRLCPHWKINAFSKDYVFVVIESESSIRVKNIVLIRFRLFPLKLSKTMELHVNCTWTLWAFFKHTSLRYFGRRFHFDAFSFFWFTFKSLSNRERSAYVWTEGLLNASKCVRFQAKTH